MMHLKKNAPLVLILRSSLESTYCSLLKLFVKMLITLLYLSVMWQHMLFTWAQIPMMLLNTQLQLRLKQVSQNPTTYPSFFLESPGVTAVGEVVFWAPLLSVCLADLPLRKRRNDSLNDFLNDLRREIGASPAPDRSETLTEIQLGGSFGYVFISLTMPTCKTRMVVTVKSTTIFSRIPICFWIEDLLTLGSCLPTHQNPIPIIHSFSQFI
jgi:hypothetical protein